MKKECKHFLEYVETISASTQISIYNDFERGDYLSCNNEYGNRLKEKVRCLECERQWEINNNSPKFIKDFVNKIEYLRDNA